MVIPRIPFPYCVIHFLVLSPPIDYRFLDAGKVPTSYIECIAVAVTFNLAYAGSLIDLHGLAIKGAQISISWFFFLLFRSLRRTITFLDLPFLPPLLQYYCTRYMMCALHRCVRFRDEWIYVGYDHHGWVA